jgi:DNA topoisomerase-1
LKKEDDPYTITLERAMQLIREKIEVEAARVIRDFPEAGIRVLNGRYGPYITDGSKNGKIPKDRDPKSLALEECQAILAAAPERKGRWGKKTATGKAAGAKAAPADGDDGKGAVAKPARKKAAPKKKAAAKKKPAAKKKT